jgi:hypothetical protein
LLLWVFLKLSSVVQDWPDIGTYCRSSVQIGHDAGGASEGGYCVPQVEQRKAGIARDYTGIAAHRQRMDRDSSGGVSTVP